MNEASFLSDFRDQFLETDPASIDMDTTFKTLPEWGSLLLISVIAMVDENYSKTLSGADIQKAQTVRDLFETLSSK